MLRWSGVHWWRQSASLQSRNTIRMRYSLIAFCGPATRLCQALNTRNEESSPTALDSAVWSKEPAMVKAVYECVRQNIPDQQKVNNAPDSTMSEHDEMKQTENAITGIDVCPEERLAFSPNGCGFSRGGACLREENDWCALQEMLFCRDLVGGAYALGWGAKRMPQPSLRLFHMVRSLCSLPDGQSPIHQILFNLKVNRVLARCLLLRRAFVRGW